MKTTSECQTNDVFLFTSYENHDKVQNTCSNHPHANCSIPMIETDYQLISLVIEDEYTQQSYTIFPLVFICLTLEPILLKSELVKYDK